MTDAKPRRIAIVDDDDQAVRDSLRFLLEAAGRGVEVFASPAEFLGAEMGDFACLILDHHMPHMTGLQLIERLRADGINIPTLLITGAPSSSLVAKAEKLCVVRILEKPPNENELMSFLDTSLS